MRMHRFAIAMAALLALVALGVVVPVHAQFGAIKKLGGKIKDGTVGGVVGVIDGARGKDEGEGNAENGPALTAQPRKIRDGEVAVIETSLPVAEANVRAKAYLNGRDLNFTVNANTGGLITDWYGERRCGIGFNRCANRAVIRVVPENGQVTIRVQVFERKREAGINDKPWNENSNSKGKETGVFADELEAALAIEPASPVEPQPAAELAAPQVAPKVIALGQSTTEVESIFGRPTTIIDLGARKTYVYPDMRVIFTDGKVSDVQ